MKINFRSYIKIAAIAVVSLLASCETTEETDFALNDKPTVTAAQTSYTVAEGETVNIPITIDEPTNKPLTFKLLIAEGATAENGLDYEAGDGPQSTDWGFADAGFSITVPAYAESFEIPITAFTDLVPQEGSETVQLVLTAAGVRNALTPTEDGIVFDITIEEVESEDFVMQLIWGETYVDASGADHSFCDFDLDLELYNEANEIVAASYSSCPEEITILAGDLPDGTYFIVASYWSPGAATPVDFDAIPATVVLAQPGVSNQSVDMTTEWTDFAAGAAEGNPNAYVTVATLEISDGTYTISDIYTPDVSEEGEDTSAYYKSARTFSGK